MPAWHLASAVYAAAPQPIPQPTGGGDRNAIPLYQFANMPRRASFHCRHAAAGLRPARARRLHERVRDRKLHGRAGDSRRQPIRSSSACVICDDPRARDVIRTGGREIRLDQPRRKPTKGRGRGFAFARYKNLAAYCGGRRRGRGRARDRPRSGCCVSSPPTTAARSSIRTASATRSRAASCSRRAGRCTRRWRSTRSASPAAIGAPIRSCASRICPSRVEVHLIDRPGQPFLGTGEAAQGPTAAAIANAIADATGARIRELPFTPRALKPPSAFEPALPLWCGVGAAAAEPGRPRRHHIVRNRTQWPPLPPDE